MSSKQELIKQEIISALTHPEAEDGLYFSNLYVLHEEDERPAVSGSELEILDALKDLIREGRVLTDDSDEEVRLYIRQ
jgi:hypothetical protein